MMLLLKKHKLVSILTIMAILFAFHPTMSFAATELSDISDHWAKEQIQSWVDSGYIKGYSDGTFKPDNNITRAEFMTMVNNAYGYTEKTDIDYTDVAEGSWYADAVAAAKAAGYIAGYPDNTMKPNNPITRQEAAVMVARIDALTSDEAAAGQFTDAASIPSWSKGAIGANAKAEIFNGYPDGTYKAENNILRSESVVALSKAKAYSDNHVQVTGTVTDVTTTGFKLTLSPQVNLLLPENIALTQGDDSVTVSAITTADFGATYTVEAALEEGQTYKLNLSKEGYVFDKNITVTMMTEEQRDEAAADAVNAQIEALPAVDELTVDDEDAVSDAKAAYDALTEAQKELVSSENKTKMNDAVTKIDELQSDTNQTEE
ncbi:MAG TPA: S-layer homology domain-containing protein [Syntrophomonas sp.]|nr:S-layer homology domain-containing protein [Syntrophomonas sp.]